MEDMTRLLLVEQDPATRTFLADNLSADGYDVVVAPDVDAGIRLAAHGPLAAAVVDVNGRTGHRFVSEVRQAADGVTDPALPILLLGRSFDDLDDRLRGFERGCDDYVCKPFSYPEVRLRLAALIRRASGGPRASYRIGGLMLEPAARVVTFGGSPVDLRNKEFELLRMLASEPTRVFTKQEILRSIWGHPDDRSIRTIDSHAHRIRKKLNDVGANSRFVLNVWGVGYRLVTPGVL